MRQIFNLKSYLTFLSRNKVYTAINVFGLSISLMFVILLVVFVRQEYSVDSHQRNLDRIYLFGTQGDLVDAPDANVKVQSYSNAGFGPVLQQHIPGIEATTAISFEEGAKVRLSDSETVYASRLAIDSMFCRVFDFELTQGDKLTALDNPDNIIISELFARKLFGDHDPMGRHLEIGEKGTKVTITGVYRSMGNSVVRSGDIIVPMSYLIRQNSNFLNYQNQMGSAELYLLASEGTDLSAKLPEFTKVLKEVCPTFFDSDTWKMAPAILPLRGLYLSDSESYMCRRGDAKMLRIFGLVALIVLLFSVMNYVNLTVAQSGYRAREMAARRLFGAYRWEIVLKLITESVALCLLSLAIGLALAVWLAPYVGQLLGGDIDLSVLTNLQFVSSESGNLQFLILLALIGLTIFIGLVAGITPAIIQSRAKPIEVVRGTFRKTTKMFFSRVFIIIQNVITIALIASALTIYFQIRHMVSAPMGYNHKGVLQLFNPHYLGYEQEQTLATATMFRDELLKLPCVELVSVCNGNPLQVGSNGYRLDDKQHWLSIFDVDENWMSLLGIHVETDYHVAGDTLAYVSQSLLSELGLPKNARDWLPRGDDSNGKRERLRGILSDFRVSDINNRDFDGRGIVIFEYKDLSKYRYWSSWLVRVKGDEEAAYQQIADLYKRTFHEEYYDRWGTGIFLDQQLASFYESQLRLLGVVSLFAAIAVLISLLGLIAMSTYFIQQRRKEIAIRKVYGSTSRQIWMKLVRLFLIYVVVAFVIAAPIVWHYMGDWLSEYAYRIQLWPCILASGAVCFIISLLAVFIQSWLAANENPINHIKDNG